MLRNGKKSLFRNWLDLCFTKGDLTVSFSIFSKFKAIVFPNSNTKSLLIICKTAIADLILILFLEVESSQKSTRICITRFLGVLYGNYFAIILFQGNIRKVSVQDLRMT